MPSDSSCSAAILATARLRNHLLFAGNLTFSLEQANSAGMSTQVFEAEEHRRSDMLSEISYTHGVGGVLEGGTGLIRVSKAEL
jgi:hypothetical protein